MTPTTAVPEVGASIRRLAARVEDFRRRQGEMLGLRGSELLALGHLFRAGSLQPRDISDRLRLSPGATTALIDRLQAAGLVERDQHPVDRRSVIVSLTQDGIATMDAITASTERSLRRRLDHLRSSRGISDEDIARFVDMADELGSALADVELPSPAAQRQVG